MNLAPLFPDFVPGRAVQLPGRGTTFIRELSGPPGAPVVVLLHGWTATAAVNWFPAMEPLAAHFRVVAVDMRGHGRGLRSRAAFNLIDCADDVAALLDQMGIDSALIAGYSTGGPISQLLARRHPEKVLGLVQCSTASHFPDSVPVGPPLGAVGWTLRRVAGVRSMSALPLARFGLYRRLPFADELGRHDPRVLVEVGHALADYDARPWLGTLGKPAASVVTTRDQLVRASLQRELAAQLGAKMYIVKSATGHGAAILAANEFVPALVAACLDVAGRARGVAAPPSGPALG